MLATFLGNRGIYRVWTQHERSGAAWSRLWFRKLRGVGVTERRWGVVDMKEDNETGLLLKYTKTKG